MGTPEQWEWVRGVFAGCWGVGWQCWQFWVQTSGFDAEAGCGDQPGTQASATLQGFGISRWWCRGEQGCGDFGERRHQQHHGDQHRERWQLCLPRSARRHPRYSLF